MNDITWLSHGGPGSGRYPKGFKLLKTKLAERRSLKTKKKYESPELNKEENQKKKYESPELKKTINQENGTESKEKENKSVRNAKLSSADYLASSAGRFKGAGAMTKEISNGVDKAWNSLHNVKYANEDRSKNVRGLTNDELRKTIERIKLDQEYNKITMPPKSKGYDRTMAALAVLGSVATVTATGLSIASGIKQLKRS